LSGRWTVGNGGSERLRSARQPVAKRALFVAFEAFRPPCMIPNDIMPPFPHHHHEGYDAMASKSSKGGSKTSASKRKRQTTSRTRAAKAAAATRTSTAASAVKRVQDSPRLKPGIPIPNTSAFESPRHVPDDVAGLSPARRGRLVSRLIPAPEPAPPEPVVRSLKALEPAVKRFHGMKVPLYWFPGKLLKSPCADKFGYMFSSAVRSATKLPFNATIQSQLNQLGGLMGDPGRDSGADSLIPAGYTYFGQFVDHDITLDATSTIDAPQDANSIPNMRTPALDLDSLYGRGPALEPFLYRFPGPGDPPTAVKMQLGRNRNFGTGGPPDALNNPATPANFDVPRVLNGTDTT
jgi:hypothetical protein